MDVRLAPSRLSQPPPQSARKPSSHRLRNSGSIRSTIRVNSFPTLTYRVYVCVCLCVFSYTGLTECDLKLRVSRLVDAESLDPPPIPVHLTSVIKNTMTFGAVMRTAQEALTAATAAASKIDLKSNKFQIEFFQEISDELASSGFQHLVHISISSTGTDSLSVRYEFPPLLTPGQADPRSRVSQHLPGVISGMVALASKGDLNTTPVHELQFLPDEERQKLIRTWSGVDAYDSVDTSDQLLQELFEETARKFPDRFAIECAAPAFRGMTYAQMSRRTNQLARWMRNNGVGVGSYVGMWMPRGMEMYIALIAILKAGGAYGQ